MMWLSPLKAAAKPPLLFSYLLLRATAVLEPTIRETVFAVRAATRDDVAAIQSCNLATLPENYATGFYEQHLHSWPHLAFVAEATTFGTLPTETPTDGASRLRGTTKAGDAALKPRKEVVGYVLGRMERHPPRYPSDVRNTRSGHITSLAVLPSWRRNGLALDLMHKVHKQVKTGKYFCVTTTAIFCHTPLFFRWQQCTPPSKPPFTCAYLMRAHCDSTPTRRSAIR